MIPLICLQKVDGASFDGVTFKSSYLHGKLFIVLLSTLFKLDLSPFNHKKTDKELVRKFLWHNVCCHISIKDFLLK